MIDYVIATKWPNGHLRTYAYGSEVFHADTLEQAEQMREFLSKRDGERNEIYIISPVPTIVGSVEQT